MCKVHDLHFLASKANLNPTNITGWNYFTYAFRRTAKFLERSYMLVNFKSTWTKAKEYCLAMAYHLLEIASVEENTFIDGLAQNNQVWIGLYGETMSPDAYVWNFSMRRPQDYNYMNWANSEPSTFSNENCVVFEFDGSWNNINCKFEKAFVCEK
ncbi:hepatic lectin-like [Ostrea edulis]|uniref:hepatic lectin-like n=1 Tax=Ostrea edulis TaxID=37623 RepID=UPI0024AFDC26|nr:hepatic lectin-like [Ostrea edulis]